MYSLAYTGFSTLIYAAVGAALVVVGALAKFLGRKK